RPRRSAGLMKWDPFTLVVVLGKDGNADGTLYLDDGASFEYEAGAYMHRRFVFDYDAGVLRSEDLATEGKKTKDYLKAMARVRVEKVVVVGAPAKWKAVTQVEVNEEGDKSSGAKRMVGLSYHGPEGGKAAWAVVRDPGVGIGRGWSIAFA
ncbi:glucosidase II, partial [Cryomyces antarcticus]